MFVKSDARSALALPGPRNRLTKWSQDLALPKESARHKTLLTTLPKRGSCAFFPSVGTATAAHIQSESRTCLPSSLSDRVFHIDA
ncbi:hypothetical protein N7530_006192 [Penicillium desertorum]|uniref:Uncharacterized protein n=1 Tax=Penicillium desertorum TaxID=1303715 RepID=A0A9X0BLW6_9EURO|nr:hypothetical protein N7530_006192 [Penicillium desertorum]